MRLRKWPPRPRTAQAREEVEQDDRKMGSEKQLIIIHIWNHPPTKKGEKTVIGTTKGE